MKKIVTLFAALFSFAAVFAAPTITGVTVTPHNPWDGKMDVDVSLSGTSDEVAKVALTFTATDTANSFNLSTASITQEGNDVGSETSWTRHFVWDVNADVGAVKIDDVQLSVKGEWQLGGVQLWENGPYFAECNIGATKPEEYGYYFWWGDTVGYKRNSSNDGWVSVKDGLSFSFSYDNCQTSGKSNSELESLGFIDSTGNITAAHDAATAHLGAPWRMPTDAEFEALLNNCDTEWTTRKGVYGRLVKGRGAYASKSIFLPATGYGYYSYLIYPGTGGYCWSSTPNSVDSLYAWYLDFYSGSIILGNGYSRYDGQSVRPVRGFADAEIAGGNAVSTNFAYVHILSDGGPYTETVDGVEYRFSISMGKATINGASTSVSGAVTIPHTLGGCPVTTIGLYAFSSCGSLTSVVIPSSVTTIGEGAFWGCSSLSEVAILAKNPQFGSEAFVGTPWYEGKLIGFVLNGGASGVVNTVVVTNVVVHYVVNSVQPEFAKPVNEDTGFVNVIAEVNGNNVAVPETWKESYPEFAATFGTDFTKALTKKTGKIAAGGREMLVWEDYVAGTDPTDPTDKFTATMTMVDGRPVISWTPELDAKRAAMRKYTTYGKVKLTDNEWTVVPEGRASDYNFFKVSVEMK